MNLHPSQNAGLLPHFPVVCVVITTRKTRIVLDASAKFQVKNLESKALPGKNCR